MKTELHVNLPNKLSSLPAPSNLKAQITVKKMSCFLVLVLYPESNIKSDLTNPHWVKLAISAVKINLLLHLHYLKGSPLPGPIPKAILQQVLINRAIRPVE